MTTKGNILITGASTGIGLACVARLAGHGCNVFAGVRKESDAENVLKVTRGKTTPVMLDVTDTESVDAAVDRVADASDGKLHGLVNNAGVYIPGPFEIMDPAEFRQTLEVNLLGVMNVTHRALPLLRSARGCIAGIGSISGRVALPGGGVYAASKFGLEALTDSLRVELAPLGVRVTVIEPGAIRTPIWDKSNRLFDKRDKTVPAETMGLYRRLVTTIRRLGANPRGIDPDLVAEVVQAALFAERPKPRYLVGRDARALARLRLLPTALRDRLIDRKLRG